MPTYQDLLQAAYDRTQPKKKSGTRLDPSKKAECDPLLDAAEAEYKARGESPANGSSLASTAFNRVTHPHFYDENLARRDDI